MPQLPQKQLPDFAAARVNMIECQLRPNKVRDERILSAMETLPREMFVAPQMAGIAYIDEDLQVMPGRYLLEPMVQARLIQDAGIVSGDRVLDIAPATGYSTAVLAALAGQVVAVESDVSLQKLAARNLATLGIKNADVVLAPLVDGEESRGPYNVIIINGAVDAIPSRLTQQLAEGGRLVAVLRGYGPGKAAHIGEARYYEKVHGAISSRPLFDANVKPLQEFAAAKTFSF